MQYVADQNVISFEKASCFVAYVLFVPGYDNGWVKFHVGRTSYACSIPGDCI